MAKIKVSGECTIIEDNITVYYHVDNLSYKMYENIYMVELKNIPIGQKLKLYAKSGEYYSLVLECNDCKEIYYSSDLYHCDIFSNNYIFKE